MSASSTNDNNKASIKVTPHQPSNFTVKKGKWYDCLRPVPGYQGFGGLGVDTVSASTSNSNSNSNSTHSSAREDELTKEEREAHAKLQDYTTKVPSLGLGGRKKHK